jgi:hypothetical protein
MQLALIMFMFPSSNVMDRHLGKCFFVRPLLLYIFVFSFLCYVGLMLKRLHSLVSHSFLFAFGLKGE